MRKRKTISRKQRWRILERDDFRCRYCSDGPPNVRLEIDHVIPVVEDGDSDDSNLVTACECCNRGKRAELLSDQPPAKSKADLLRRAFDEYANTIPRKFRMELTVVNAVARAIHEWRDHPDDYGEWVSFFLALEEIIKQVILEDERSLKSEGRF